MFTGIVEETGFIKSFDGHKLVVECSKVLDGQISATVLLLMDVVRQLLQ